MHKLITILILAAILLTAIPVYADAPGDTRTVELLEQQLRRERLQQQEQYYRGIYDSCVWALVQEYGLAQATGACRQMVREFQRERWYEQESPGWVWPVVGAGENI